MSDVDTIYSNINRYLQGYFYLLTFCHSYFFCKNLPGNKTNEIIKKWLIGFYKFGSR